MKYLVGIKGTGTTVIGKLVIHEYEALPVPRVTAEVKKHVGTLIEVHDKNPFVMQANGVLKRLPTSGGKTASNGPDPSPEENGASEAKS